MIRTTTAPDGEKLNETADWRIRYAAICTALIFFAGCTGGVDGPARGSVEGEVTLDGTPVQNGSIVFIPSSGTSGPSAGGTISQGKFSIAQNKGPVVGKYMVQIRASEKTGKSVPAGSPFPPGTMIDETIEIIPKKYNTESELEREIVAGNNPFDFQLTTK